MPHLLKTLGIMFIHTSAGLWPHLQRLHSTDLLPRDQNTLLRLQQSHNPLTGPSLPFQVPQMEKQPNLHNIHLALQLPQGSSVLEDIRLHEVGAEGSLVEEQLIAQGQELRLQVSAVEIGGRRAIVNEFPQVLREAAAEIEEGSAVL